MGWVDGLACSIKSRESYCKVYRKDICILALGRGWQLPWGKYFSPVIAVGAFGILQEYSGCTEDSLAVFRCHSWDERLLHLAQVIIPLHPANAFPFCSTSLSCWGKWWGMKQYLTTFFRISWWKLHYKKFMLFRVMVLLKDNSSKWCTVAAVWFHSLLGGALVPSHKAELQLAVHVDREKPICAAACCVHMETTWTSMGNL